MPEGIKFVKIGALWRNSKGDAALTGSLGGKGGPRVYVFPSKNKKGNGPDYDLVIAPPAPPRDSAPSQAEKELDNVPF